MRRGTPVLWLTMAVLLVGACAACSDAFWDPGGIEFRLDGPEDVPQPPLLEVMSFTATGAPVDDGDMCGAGIVAVDQLETVDGVAISFKEAATIFDAAEAGDGTVEVHSVQTFECADGSGTFTMKVRTQFDFGVLGTEGEQDVGRWEIQGGTGAYADLGGSGDVTHHYEVNDLEYSGDLR